jgi:hypothetical protein
MKTGVALNLVTKASSMEKESGRIQQERKDGLPVVMRAGQGEGERTVHLILPVYRSVSLRYEQVHLHRFQKYYFMI